MTKRDDLEAGGYKTYKNNDIEVFWNPRICQHAGKCVRGNAKVFDAKRRPWVDVSQAPVSEIARVIDQCPSGALQYVFNNKIRIEFDEENDRSLAYDGSRIIGECVFSNDGNIWMISHTGVRKEYEGRGIARHLVQKVIDEARIRKVKILPLCPYAQKMMTGNPEYSDVLR